MKSRFIQMICRLLIVSMVWLPIQSVQAGMIGSSQAAAASSAQADRNAVLAAVSRADVAGQMQSMGVDPVTAKARIAAMTDDEVRTLAGNLNTLPAGADSGWAWALVIIIAIVVWYNWK